MGRYKTPMYNKGKGAAHAWIVEHIDYAGDDCLPWPFSKTRGRGILGHNGERYYACRLMCEYAHGPAPSPEHEAAHSCGKGHESCTNPRHLSWKTRTENRRDCIEHGTSIRTRPNSLTKAQADEIRPLRGVETADVVAARYGVSPTAVYLIWQGHTFKPGALYRNPRWTAEEDDKLREAVRLGMSDRQAGEYIGRSGNHIWRRRAKLGLPKNAVGLRTI